MFRDVRISLVDRAALTALIGALIAWRPAFAESPSPPKPPTLASLKWYTPDRDFRPIEPAPWVYEGVQKVFIGDFANQKTLPYMDELAAAGVTVIHSGGPAPYYPLRRDGGTGSDPKEAAALKAAFEHARKLKLRVVVGVSPYAPPEI